MKVMVTGANGFIGKHLVNEFSRRGYDVLASARSQITDLPVRAQWIPAPSLGPDAEFGWDICNCDVVVHAAARVHVMKENSTDPLVEYRKANVEGTVALARAAAKADTKLFVFLSSIKVNGEETPIGRKFDVKDTPDPQDAYGLSKAEAEKALFDVTAETGMTIVVVRPVLVYGPGVKGNFRTMMATVARGVPLPLGAISNRRSMLYVGNLADLIARIIERKGPKNQVLLASDGDDVSTSQLLRLLGDGLGRPARLLPVPHRIQRLISLIFGRNAALGRLLGSLQVDIGAAQSTLNWTPPFNVVEGIAATTKDFLENAPK